MRYTPWVATQHRPDTRSPQTLLSFPGIAGRKAEDLAIAVWKYCVNKDYGFYHFWTPEEKTINDEKSPGGVRDPLSLINSYGAFLCGTAAAVEAWLWQNAGLGSRVVGLTGHCVCEAFYDGGWHLLDADLQAYHRHHPPRHYMIASCADCIQDPTLVSHQKNPSNPYYLEDRSPENMARSCYQPGNLTYFPRYCKDLHTMDYVLRRGEEMVRFYSPQGRWFCPPSWVEDAKKYKNEWLGDGPRERFEPHRRYGNGFIRYHPDMTTGAILEGVLSSEGFSATERGLAAELEPASITVPVFSPYVIVGRRPDWKKTHESSDGAYVSIKAAGASTLRLFLSTDDGETYSQVPLSEKQTDNETTYEADFTPKVENYYRYLLRLEVSGENALLTDFDLTTWFQVNPGTLPLLKAGRNTVVVESPRSRPLPCILKLTPRLDDYLVSYRGERVDEDTRTIKAADGGVEAVLRIAPPYGAMAGLRLFASFQPAPPDEKHYEATYEWAPSADGPWKEFHRGEVPHEIEGQGRWPWGDAADLRLPGDPASELFIRLRCPFDLWEVETRLDLVEVLPAPDEPPPLAVDFNFDLGGQKRTETVMLPAGETRSEKTIELPADPAMESVRMYVKD